MPLATAGWGQGGDRLGCRCTAVREDHCLGGRKNRREKKMNCDLHVQCEQCNGDFDAVIILLLLLSSHAERCCSISSALNCAQCMCIHVWCVCVCVCVRWGQTDLSATLRVPAMPPNGAHFHIAKTCTFQWLQLSSWRPGFVRSCVRNSNRRICVICSMKYELKSGSKKSGLPKLVEYDVLRSL